jgi:tetratricopeptide (TPR) repeat protein
MTLSLAMIVKNESKNLRRCLDSVYDLVDEMIIVDTGSEDDTVAIAESYGATVIRSTWNNNFAESRNLAVGACSCDWILTLDADECLHQHDDVRRAMASDYDGIVFPIRNYFTNGFAVLFDQVMQTNDGEYYAEYSHFGMFPGMRMFRNHKGFHYSGCIHEQLVNGKDDRLNGAFVPAIIHHFGKCDLERELKKRGDYFNLAKRQVEEEPLNAQAWFNLMAQASVAGDAETSIAAAEVLLTLVETPHIAVLTTLGMAYQAVEKHRDALNCFVKALELQPDHALSMTRIPVSLSLIGAPEKAIEVCEYALSVYPDMPSAWTIYAETEMYRGDMKRAKEIMEEGLRHCPGDSQCLTRLKEIEDLLEAK